MAAFAGAVRLYPSPPGRRRVHLQLPQRPERGCNLPRRHVIQLSLQPGEQVGEAVVVEEGKAVPPLGRRCVPGALRGSLRRSGGVAVGAEVRVSDLRELREAVDRSRSVDRVQVSLVGGDGSQDGGDGRGACDVVLGGVADAVPLARGAAREARAPATVWAPGASVGPRAVGAGGLAVLREEDDYGAPAGREPAEAGGGREKERRAALAGEEEWAGEAGQPGGERGAPSRGSPRGMPAHPHRGGGGAGRRRSRKRRPA